MEISDVVSETGNILKREDGYLLVHRVRMLSGVDDPQVMEIEVLKSSVYGLCNKWCLVELHFHTVTTASVEKKKIDSHSIMGGPEKRLRRFNHVQDLLQGEPFP